MDMEVMIFFTFYGLPLLNKKIDAKISPHSNPAMPMKMSFGHKGFQNITGRFQSWSPVTFPVSIRLRRAWWKRPSRIKVLQPSRSCLSCASIAVWSLSPARWRWTCSGFPGRISSTGLISEELPCFSNMRPMLKFSCLCESSAFTLRPFDNCSTICNC